MTDRWCGAIAGCVHLSVGGDQVSAASWFCLASNTGHPQSQRTLAGALQMRRPARKTEPKFSPATFHFTLHHHSTPFQADNGAQTVQIFDSWAANLSPRDFDVFAGPYLHYIIKKAKEASSRVVVL